MAFYPEGKFVYTFAHRTLENLVSVRREEPLKFKDTALLSFLLAVFVLPDERLSGDDKGFMADLLKRYDDKEPLSETVEILRQESKSPDAIPTSLDKVPAFIRNSIAHLNIKPESQDGQQLTHLLVWNNISGDPKSRTTFVARINIEKLRVLAEYILEQLCSNNRSDKYNGIDPLRKFDDEHCNKP
jgi:hypothetical protein